jgi:tetratricopeptide (TPR) repeat protein
VEDTEHYDVLSSILNRLGGVHYHRGQWREATMCVERALELREQLGDIVGMARSFNNLGIVKKNAGNWNEALKSYEQSVEIHEQIGEVEGLTQALTNLGVLHTDRGEWDKAEKYLGRSFSIAERIAYPYELAQAHMNLGRLHLFQEHWEISSQHLNSAIPLYKEAGARANLNLNDAYDLKGRWHLEQGELETALEWAHRSRELLQRVTKTDAGDSVAWGRYEQLMGRIAYAHVDFENARQHLKQSAEIFSASGVEIEAGRTAYWSGKLFFEQDQMEKARARLIEAREIFHKLGAKADLERVEKLISQLGDD